MISSFLNFFIISLFRWRLMYKTWKFLVVFKGIFEYKLDYKNSYYITITSENFEQLFLLCTQIQSLKFYLFS